MKILIVNTAAYPSVGGVENSLNFMALELKKLGHEVLIWTIIKKKDDPRELFHNGIKIIKENGPTHKWPHKRLSVRLQFTEDKIKSILSEFKPDAVWSRSAVVGLGVLKAGFTVPVFQIFSTNAYMSCRGNYLETKGLPFKQRVMRWMLFPLEFQEFYRIERALLKHCYPVCFSENMAGQIAKSYNVSINAINIIKPGVDIEKYNPEKGYDQLSCIKEKFSLSSEDKLILYVGRLAVSKNVYLIVDALKLLPVNVKLILVGSGSEEQRIRKYVKNCGVGKRVIFAGWQNELLPGFYGISKVTVLPTKIESFGQVLLEAMACGTPVISFGRDGKKFLTASYEIIVHNKTGKVLKDYSADALALAVKSILSLTEKEYKKMSENCVERVIENYSWHNFVKEMLERAGRK